MGVVPTLGYDMVIECKLRKERSIRQCNDESKGIPVISRRKMGFYKA
jgi:hypothetical protein